MNRAQPLDAQVGLVPLPRPLMTGEVLDAAFRLFRAGLLRCLPYSGLAVLVLELPTLYETFFLAQGSGIDGRSAVMVKSVVSRAPSSSMPGEYITYLIAVLLSVALFGVITLRLAAIARGERPRFRKEIATVIRRWPTSIIATFGALGFPAALVAASSVFNNILPTEVMFVVAVPILWPTALFVVALPAFWCDGLGPFAAIGKSLRVSVRRSWRMFGTLLTTASLVAVCYALAALVVGLLTPFLGRADLFLFATVTSMLMFVVGVIGVPFVLSVLIVSYEDLKLRDLKRRGARA
jgi:hypothetical protein